MEPEARRETTLFAALATRSGVLTALASFVVYMLGYLALRFQLTALGVGTDLDLLDERYLFEGAKFLIYLVATMPIVVLIGLLVAPLAWLAARARPSLATLGRLMARMTRRRPPTPAAAAAVPAAPAARQELDIGGLIVMVSPPSASAPVAAWQARSALTLTAGVVSAVLIIQLVMRRCFAFDNLLLRDELPEPAWFAALLTPANDLPAQIYFALLVAGIAALSALVFSVGPWRDLAPAPRGLAMLLAGLVGIQALLLPVNYGVLMAGRALPRLAANSQALTQPAGGAAVAWLIWEGKTGMTFLVHEPTGPRKLVTMPRDKVPRIEIVAYEPLAVLRAPQTPRAPQTLIPPASSWTLERLAAVFVGPSTRAVRSRPEARGDIYFMAVAGDKAEPLTKKGVYHSPVFLRDGHALVALCYEEGVNRLVRLELKGGPATSLALLKGARRLIGIDPDNPKAIFFVADVEGGLCGMRFDMDTKESSPVTAVVDAEDQALVRLLGDDRERQGLFVKDEGLDSPGTNIVRQCVGEPETNLTKSSRESNRQPVLSEDGKFLAFVR